MRDTIEIMVRDSGQLSGATSADQKAGLSPDETPAGAGDDDALILWMLSLTPTQRLEVAQGFAESVVALRNGDRS